MKKFAIGLVVGMCLMVSVTVFASGTTEKINAFINNSIKIKIDGKEFSSDFPILVFDGRTYLPLRTVGEDILNMVVDWDGETQTVLMDSKINVEDGFPVNEVTEINDIEKVEFNNIKAITSEGNTYFELVDYNRKAKKEAGQVSTLWGYNSQTRTIYLAKSLNGALLDEPTLLEISMDEPNAVIIHEGLTHLSTKYYQTIE